MHDGTHKDCLACRSARIGAENRSADAEHARKLEACKVPKGARLPRCKACSSKLSLEVSMRGGMLNVVCKASPYDASHSRAMAPTFPEILAKLKG